MKIFFLSATICLSGCSSVSEVFDTPPGEGVGNKPISEVNRMVSQGSLGKEDPSLPQVLSPVMGIPSLKPSAFVLSDKTVIQRVPEQTGRVWIAPFQDEQGNFHEGSIVHTLITPSSWKIVSGKGS